MGQFLDSAGLASNTASISTPTDGKKSTTSSTIPISSVMSALTSGGGTGHVSIGCSLPSRFFPYFICAFCPSIYFD